jgi:outer membrane protein assembly factor BamB
MNLRRAAAIGLWLASLTSTAEDWITGNGGHSDRNGRSSEHGPTSPAILWDECPHSSIAPYPPVIGGNVVLTSRLEDINDLVHTTWIVAQDLDTGDELWSVQLPINFPDSWWSRVLAIRDGLVYATRATNGNSNLDYLYALDVADGSEAWHSEDLIDSSTETPAFAENGDLIVGRFASLMRIDHTDGSTLWETARQCPSSDGCDAAVFGDAVYVLEVLPDPGGLAYVVARYDAVTGQRLYGSLPLRVQFFGINQVGLFVGPDGTVYAPLSNNTPGDAMVALADSGTALTEKWRFPLPYIPFASFATGPDGTVYTYSTDDEVVRLDPADGNVLSTSLPIPWDAAGWFPRVVVDGRGRVFLNNAAVTLGRLYAFDAGLRLHWSDPVPDITLGGPAIGANGTLVVAASGTTVRAYRTPFSGDIPMRVDASLALDGASNANDVMEPGETVGVQTSWENSTHADAALAGTASNLTGPGGGLYAIDDASADYGVVAAGATSNCGGATADCFVVTVGDPGARPAAHWDATFDESLSGGTEKTWTLHVGGSFPDVPDSDLFYPFVETILHNGVTAGCGTGGYCRDAGVTRAQMAVFLLRARHGQAFAPLPATGTVFEDVPAGAFAAAWIEELAREGITGGCSITPALYCPENVVTRAQMAVFLLKAEHGKRFVPPPCVGTFSDVACPGGFAVDWIERLAAEQVTAGCGGGAYCPDAPNTRGQMAPFLVKTFGLRLYGP